MTSHLKPFQLLEINITLAQDLEPVSKKMGTYATAWCTLNASYPRLWMPRATTILCRTTSSCSTSTRNSYAATPRQSILRFMPFVGSSTRSLLILVGNLTPPSSRTHHHHHHHHFGTQIAALQVRRPSGRPQGILNMGMSVLDSSMRSMPVYNCIPNLVGQLLGTVI